MPAAKDDAKNDAVMFSYATCFVSPWQRRLVRWVELATGQPCLKRLYEQYSSRPGTYETFWHGAVRLLRLDIDLDRERLAEIPKQGPVVFVANHPFGVLDGIVICWLMSQVRTDFKVLTNSVLYQAQEAKPFILPIDFAETKDALKTNLETRATALKYLKEEGGAVIVFPAGGISTAPRGLGTAIDDEWKPFTAKMIQASGATVIPIFFEGQNSRLFQMASMVSPVARLSLVFREVYRRMGDRIDVRIGEPISPEEISDVRGRVELMSVLRDRTYGLGEARKRRGLRGRPMDRFSDDLKKAACQSVGFDTA